VDETSPEHPVLTELLARIAERIPPERRETVAAFAKALTRRLSDEELAESDPEQLYGQVTSAFAFTDSRGLHPIAVRVFDPDREADGYVTPGTVIETNTDDSPFLVDSVSEELAARTLQTVRRLHPVIGTARDEEGHLERVMSARDASHRESFMHFEVDRRLLEAERADVETRVKRILKDVRLVVRDFEPMQGRVRHMIELARAAGVRYDAKEVGEAVDFLEWLLQLNFVLLGYREYELLDTPQGRAIEAVPNSGLGILSDTKRSTFAGQTLLSGIEPALRARIEDGELLIYSKTNSYSTVHRRARMDYIGVRRVNAEGEIVGEARLIGLFTSKAYMEPAAKTPLLHHKLEQVLAAEDLIPGGHDYKSAIALFESFPKDELF
jgi:glutamate dehydrogenase